MLASARAVDAERDDDVGPQGPDVPDEVAENLGPAPLLERFLRTERVAEVHRTGEVLLGAVVLVRRQQLFGAEDAERIEQLRADLVLPAVTARRRHQRHAHAQAPGVPRQHRVVLVVRMRRGLHQRADGVELAQRHGQAGRARQVADRGDAILRRPLLSGAGRESWVRRARSSARRLCIVEGQSLSGQMVSIFVVGRGPTPGQPMGPHPHGCQRSLRSRR